MQIFVPYEIFKKILVASLSFGSSYPIDFREKEAKLIAQTRSS